MLIACDIETESLKIDTKINYVGCYTETDEFYGFKIPRDLEKFKNFIAKADNPRWIFHNGKFDTCRLMYSYGIDLPIHHDTILLAYINSTVDELKNNQGRWLGLKHVAKRILGVDDWNISTKDKTSEEDSKVFPYLEKDCKYTMQIFKHFVKITPANKYRLYTFLLMATNAYKNIELTGLPIDLTELDKVREEFVGKQTDVDTRLRAFADINYNSSKQLQKLLYEDLKLPVVKMTAKGAASTDSETLTDLKDLHPIMPVLLEKREIEKILAFLTSWKNNAVLHSDGYNYLHSSFNLHGTVTGRTSSSEVNLQQIPRNKRIKSLFASQSDEWELVCMDYSQLELRFAAIVADVQAMKESYRNGEDLHKKMASVITGKPASEITKEERTQAKAANFG